MADYHKEKFKKIAEDTQSIFDSGGFKEEIDYCYTNTRLYEPGGIFVNLEVEQKEDVEISVIESTTTNAAYEMFERFGRACVLNFASAKKPGGGWKNGSVAQEESLARVSGLYYSLIKYNEIYKGKWAESNYYQDYYIYSEDVPFIKDDEGILMNTVPISVITSASVNRNCFKTITEDIENTIEHIMRKRINDIFRVAINNGQRHIVLGAYGCGVFKNDSKDVAEYFKDSLGRYKNSFDSIVFAIYDNTPNKEVLNNFKSII